MANLLLLAHALSRHEGALRASLQAEYGLRLLPDGQGRTEPYRTPRELADLVEHLPAGCALFRAMGGAAALSNEALMGRAVEHTLRDIAWQKAGAKGKRPEPFPLPKPAGQEEAAAAVVSEKARRWQERQERRDQPK